jgi:hypothetical protein
MPACPVLSLMRPWWALWGLERLKESSITAPSLQKPPSIPPTLKSPLSAGAGQKRAPPKEPAPLIWAMRELLLRNFEAVRCQRGMDYTTVALRAGMTYKQLVERRHGQTYLNSSLPVHELHLLANALGVEVQALIPTCRELYTLATDKLLNNYHKANPDDARFPLARAASSAYVEYHCAQPDCRGRGTLDRAAAQRTCLALGGRLSSVEETIEVLISIGTAIDVIYFSLEERLA